ncbi:MAG: Flp pilus assembly protein CpaB [Candidatus Solibacter sp.]|nr:Flp pilus assembly protein CpaB [Candidatus Solibacter sp.]
MNKRFVGVLTFAFLVAAGASLVLYRVLINRTTTTNAGPALAQVALASKDLEVGTVLKEGDVKVADWPGAVPLGATNQVKDIIGRGVITAIFAKEPIIDSRLAPKGAGGGMASMIPPGMRAVAVRVNEVVGVAGFVVPGTHVDVLISGTAPGGNGNLGTLTQTLLQNIEVLSAGQDFKKDAEGKPIMVQVVNMLVTPTQAEQLSLAASQTSIQLVLRNPLDHMIAKTPGTALQHLFNGGRTQAPPPDLSSRPRTQRVAPAPIPVHVAAPPPPKEIPFVMEIISGPTKREQKFGGTPEVK